MYSKTKSALSLIAWIVALLLVSGLIGRMTTPNIDPWYIHLNKSALNPPGYVFGMAWSVLYILIAISGWLLWQKKDLPELKGLKTAFIIQLILNWCWTPLFFELHLMGLSLAIIGAIIILGAYILIRAHKNIKPVTWLMLPYWVWLLFAFYLNFFIWHYN